MTEPDDDLIPCPTCGSLQVERHYSRIDGGTQPGCLDCESSLPLDERREAVAAKRSSWA